MSFYKNYFEDSANVIKSLTKEEKKIKLILKNITNSINNNKKNYSCREWWLKFSPRPPGNQWCRSRNFQVVDVHSLWSSNRQ